MNTNELIKYCRINEKALNESLNAGLEYADASIFAYKVCLSYGMPDDIAMTLPTIRLALDAILSAYANDRTFDELVDLLTGKSRRMAIVGCSNNPIRVLALIRDKKITTLEQFVYYQSDDKDEYGKPIIYGLDMEMVLNHCLSFLTANMNGKSVYYMLTVVYKVPEWALPFYVAVDSGARYPAMNGSTDAMNVIRRILNMNANGKEWNGNKRVTLMDVCGYMNVLVLGLPVRQIRPHAHTNHDESDEWGTIETFVTFKSIVAQFATA